MEASVLCPLEKVDGNIQSLSHHCLTFGLLHEEEKQYQSLDCKRFASLGLFNNTTI